MLLQLHDMKKSNNHPSSQMDFLLFLNVPYFLHGHLILLYLHLPLMNHHRLQPSLNIRRSLSNRVVNTFAYHVTNLSHGYAI
jgi:formate hydrogenlyase subunit 4